MYSHIEFWILDSNASFHLIPCKELLHNYVTTKFRKVHPTNDEPLDIIEKGEVHIKTTSKDAMEIVRCQTSSQTQEKSNFYELDGFR